MPINRPMMKAIKKQYGAAKGKAIYYALENKNKQQQKSKPKPASKSKK